MPVRGTRRGGKTVILAAGDFPKKGGAAERLLLSARRVVACDGAVRAYRRRTGRDPDVIVGDLDSAPRRAFRCEVVRVAEQETNDLEKAIALCRARGWDDLVILGATGRREDHAIGNVFRALAAEVPVVSDYGTFHPVRGRCVLTVRPGTGVSVFAADPAVRMTSRGLVWPLDGVRFAHPAVATLNRAAAARIEVTSDRPAYVYVCYNVEKGIGA